MDDAPHPKGHCFQSGPWVLKAHRAVDNFVKNFVGLFYFEYLCLLSCKFFRELNHSKFNEFKYLNVFSF
jgi:hypothetical protein